MPVRHGGVLRPFSGGCDPPAIGGGGANGRSGSTPCPVSLVPPSRLCALAALRPPSNQLHYSVDVDCFATPRRQVAKSQSIRRAGDVSLPVELARSSTCGRGRTGTLTRPARPPLVCGGRPAQGRQRSNLSKVMDSSLPKSSCRGWSHQNKPFLRQHFLKRLPLPQGQRSLRPSFSSSSLSP